MTCSEPLSPVGALQPRLKIWLSSDREEGVFGDGKWRLLQALEKTGSLTAAAAALKISYRKAWGDLRKAERCLEASLVERRRGGRTGGETRLTPVGQVWLETYSRFRRDVESAVAQAYAQHLEHLVK